MAIPDFQSTMLPALHAVSTKDAIPSREVVDMVAKHFKLTQEEIDTLLPSKTQRVIENRVHWALSYMFKAGLISKPGRGQHSITEEGKKVLNKNLDRLTTSYLMNFESFRKFKELKHVEEKGLTANQPPIDDDNTNPLELIEKSYQDLRSSVIDELLRIVRALDPTDFEKLVMELLKKMGYGASDLESVMHKGKSGDGGIDGEISQDRLGLDMIYVQAKRYAEDSGVGRQAIQQFVGSLNERKAKKGIFITSSYFANTVKDYVDRVDVKIVLIDGLKLADLMYEYDLGVEKVQNFEVKKINSDFFED